MEKKYLRLGSVAPAMLLSASLVTGVGAVSAGTVQAGAVSRVAVTQSVSGPAAAGSLSGPSGVIGRTATSGPASSAQTAPGTAQTQAARLPIGTLIRYILNALGKSATWLKDQVARGYTWFKTQVWDKLPGWVRWIAGGSAWEVFNQLKDYFF